MKLTKSVLINKASDSLHFEGCFVNGIKGLRWIGTSIQMTSIHQALLGVVGLLRLILNKSNTSAKLHTFWIVQVSFDGFSFSINICPNKRNFNLVPMVIVHGSSNLIPDEFPLCLVRVHSHCAYFSDCDCDSSYWNKWDAQDFREVEMEIARCERPFRQGWRNTFIQK